MSAAAVHSNVEPATQAAPRLKPEQMHEALREAWPARLTRATGAAVVITLAATVAPCWSAEALGLQVALGLALAAALGALFMALRRGAVAKSWLPAAGIAVVTLTQINLMACLLAPAAAGFPPSAELVVVLLAVGTVWALTVELSREGLGWTAVLTFAILWAPWIARGESPAAFALAAAACLALSLRLRSTAARRLCADYSLNTLLPRLWQARLQSTAAPDPLSDAEMMQLSVAFDDDFLFYPRRPVSKKMAQREELAAPACVS